jgi:phage-related minor tail protein
MAEEPQQGPQQGRVWTEELKVQGDALLGKVKEVAHEGNVRRIIIKDTKGKTLLEVPLTVGVVGALVAPVAAAIGAVAALAADYSIVIERKENGEAASGSAPPTL